MDFERGLIRFAQYTFALVTVLLIASYFNVYPSSTDIAVAFLIGLIVSLWEGW